MKLIALGMKLMAGSFVVGIGLWLGLCAGVSVMGIPEIHPVVTLSADEADLLRAGVIDILQNVCAG